MLPPSQTMHPNLWYSCNIAHSFFLWRSGALLFWLFKGIYQIIYYKWLLQIAPSWSGYVRPCKLPLLIKFIKSTIINCLWATFSISWYGYYPLPLIGSITLPPNFSIFLMTTHKKSQHHFCWLCKFGQWPFLFENYFFIL